MRAALYHRTGDPDVIEVVERPDPVPQPGELLVEVAVSGVNPTDWKTRRGPGPGQPLPWPESIPNQDGAGVVLAAGTGADPARVGQRVWLWEAAHEQPGGTAATLVTVPISQAVALPDDASFDLGASLGIPALTAHRCLTVGESRPSSLAPGSLTGTRVLVSGGAGAVGHAAIQLARWAGATVIATVSSQAKAALATAAGAHHVVDYTAPGASDAVWEAAPDGVDTVVEVALAANVALDVDVLAPHGTLAAYANDRDAASIPIRPSMLANARYQFVYVYTVPPAAKEAAVADVARAVADGALPVGDEAGLPLHRFPLEGTAAAHAAVEDGVVGKVLIDVGPTAAQSH